MASALMFWPAGGGHRPPKLMAAGRDPSREQGQRGSSLMIMRDARVAAMMWLRNEGTQVADDDAPRASIPPAPPPSRNPPRGARESGPRTTRPALFQPTSEIDESDGEVDLLTVHHSAGGASPIQRGMWMSQDLDHALDDVVHHAAVEAEIRRARPRAQLMPSPRSPMVSEVRVRT